MMFKIRQKCLKKVMCSNNMPTQRMIRKQFQFWLNAMMSISPDPNNEEANTKVLISDPY